MVDSDRQQQRERWIAAQLGEHFQISRLAGDASFRCYYRVQCGDRRYVLMDAPPPHEDVAPFLAVHHWFERAGIRVSEMFAEQRDAGFLLMEDFGDQMWSTYRLTGGEMAPLFTDALAQLHRLQASDPGFELPLFDLTRMRRECDLYLDWYLPRVAGYEPDECEREQFHAGLSELLQTIADLPRVPVHLDYHSRNLMLPAGQLPLGIIDYQDAVLGPVTYDLASLLYDCYQDYPETERQAWSLAFYQQLPAKVANAFESFEHWHKLLRLTALQRHIKAIGIFGRLAYRDGKLQFLDEIPLTRQHLMDEMQFLGLSEDRFPLLCREIKTC